MRIEQNYSLEKHNTFHLPVKTRWFMEYETEEELQRILHDEYFQECLSLHIGGGSNLLFFYLQRVFLPVEQLVGKYPSPPIYHRGAENLIQDTLLLREYGIYGEVQQDTKMVVISPYL